MNQKYKVFRVLFCFLLSVLMFVSCVSNPKEQGTSTETNTEADSTVCVETEDLYDEPASNLVAQIYDQDIVVGRTTEGDYCYYGWPTICVDENDVLYAVVSNRAGHFDPFGRHMFFTSTDKGLTWSKGTIINDTIMDERDSGLLYVGNGRMILSSFTHAASYYKENEAKWRKNVTDEMYTKLMSEWDKLSKEETAGVSYIRISDDYGKTWGDPIKVPISAPHGPIKLKDGTLMFVGKTSYGAAEAGLTTGVYAYVSTNNGKTWKIRSKIFIDDKYSETGSSMGEPHAVELENGRILAAVRLNGTNAPYGFSIATCYSDDGGYTWSDWTELNFEGAPPHLIQLTNGVVVLSYAKRAIPTGEYARISYDNGETWSKQITLSKPNDTSSDNLGYPATVQLKDGTLVTVYYQLYGNDKNPSLLCTRWKLVSTDKK